MWKAVISTGSRRHASRRPSSVVTVKPLISTIWALGECSPGIHLGSDRTSGPGETGRVSVTLKTFRVVSLTSTLRSITPG